MCDVIRLLIGQTILALLATALLSPAGVLAQNPDGILRGHEGAVMMGFFTPDGGHALTVSVDQTARLWRLSDGKQLREYNQHTGPIYSLAVSRDGRTLVTGAQDNTLRIWDLPLPHPVETAVKHEQPVHSIVLHPDGQTLLAASADQTLALHTIGTLPPDGKPPVPILRKGHTAEVLSAACRNDAGLYASADSQGNIILWSPFLEEPQRKLLGHAGKVNAVRFHANNQQLITSGDDGCLRIWQLLPPAPRTVATLPAEVVDVAMVGNQPIAITAQANGAVRVLNLTNDQTIAEYPQQPAAPTSVAAAPNGAWVVLGGKEGQATLLNYNDGMPRGKVAGHVGTVTDVVAHPDSTRFLTSGVDGSIRFWQQPQAESQFQGHAANIKSLVAASSGQWFATISDDKTTRIWDANGNAQRQMGNHEQPLTAVTLRDDDAQLATGDAAGTVWIWNPADGSAQGVVAAHTGAITAMAFSADRTQLVTAGADNQVRGWMLPLPPKKPADGEEPVQPLWTYPVTTGEPVTQIVRLAADAGYAALPASGQRIIRLNPAGQEAASIAVSPAVRVLTATADGTNYVAIDDQGQAQFRDVQGTVVRTITLGPGIKSARLSRDGLELVTTDAQPRVRIYDAQLGLLREELASSMPVTDAAWLGADFRNIAAMGATPAGVVIRRALLRLLVDTAPVNGTARPVMTIVPTTDQQFVLAARQQGNVEQWNLSDGSLVRQFDAAGDALKAITLSPNGQFVAAVGSQEILHLWQTGDGQVVRTFPVSPEAHSLSISPDNTRVATAHQDGGVRVWDMANGNLLETMTGHAASVVSVYFQSDSRTLVTGSADKTVRVTQTSVIRTIPLSPQPILGMNLYNGGSHAMVATTDGQVQMIDLSSGTVAREFRVPLPKPAAVADVPAASDQPQYSPIQPTVVVSRNDNQRVAAGTKTGEVIIWNANNGDEVLATFKLESPVLALAFSPDNQKLATASQDGKIQIYGPSIPGTQPQKEWILHQEIQANAAVTDLQFATDNRSMWASQMNGEIQRWAYAAPGQYRQFNHGGPVYGVAITHDGRTAVSCSTDQTVRVWDVTTGQQRFQLNGHEGAVHAVALNPDESLAVSSGADGTLRLWDIVGGRQIKELIRYPSTMYSIAIHPQGNLVAAVGADRKVHLLDLITGNEQRVLEGHSDYIHSVQFSPDGSRLLSFGYAGFLKEWNVGDGNKIHESRQGTVGNFASFSPDGRQLLLSNGDGTARTIAAP